MSTPQCSDRRPGCGEGWRRSRRSAKTSAAIRRRAIRSCSSKRTSTRPTWRPSGWSK